MAIEPVSLGLFALTGYGLYSIGQRRGRRIRRAGAPPKRKVVEPSRLRIADDCGSWDMPETWILQRAQPRFYGRLLEALRSTQGDLEEAEAKGLLDPVSLTYAVLDGEIGQCPMPRAVLDDGAVLSFRELQPDLPQRPDYYPHPAILGLFDTIFEAVEAALEVFRRTGDPARALLFPV